MKNKANFLVLKPLAVYTFLITLIIFSLVKSETVSLSVKSSLLLCVNVIIPTLFPFFVFSKILIKTGFADFINKPLTPICKALFKTDGSGAFAFIIGIICGYPTGASVICDLYKENKITKNEAKKLLPFCNNSGPLFVIGAVGSVMLNSIRAGLFLYGVHVASALITGIVLSFFIKDNNLKPQKMTKKIKTCDSLGKIISESVDLSVGTILNICGLIVIFGIFITFLSSVIDLFFKGSIFSVVLNGILEITLGIKELSTFAISKTSILVITSFLIGFGGICVFLQVLGIVSATDIGIKTYFFGKLFLGFVSGIISYFLLKGMHISVFNQSVLYVPPLPIKPFWSFFTLVFVLCLISFIKKRKLF